MPVTSPHDEGNDLFDEAGDALEDGLLHGIDVAGNAGDEFAGAGIAMVGD